MWRLQGMPGGRGSVPPTPLLMHRKAVNSRKKSCVSTKTGFQPPELFLWKYNVPLGINRTHGRQEFSFLFFVPLQKLKIVTPYEEKLVENNLRHL